MTEALLRRPDLFMPEPEPREVRYTIISVDDHLVEPPNMFDGRLSGRFAEQAPKVIEIDRQQTWEFEGEQYPQIGLNAVAGRRPDAPNLEPARFDEMRRGCWDIHARIKDMDIAGIWASMNFPSLITGFCGRVFSQAKDPELGLAVTRAWNDWLYEEWYSPYPERIIPMGITWLTDAKLGAEEIRRNAERGFRSVTLPERPHRLGLPSLFSGFWDPIIEACAETDTVISLHVGSSGMNEHAPGAPGLQLGATLFSMLSLQSCAEWLWSAYAVRYPDLKIVMSEGGMGWVAMLIDRLNSIVDRSGYGKDWPGDLRPAEVLKRNFYWCTFDDPSTIDTRHAIGVDHLMLEVDYPHGDSTWPDTQDVIADAWSHIPDDEIRLMTHQNAARVYRHPLPKVCLP